MRHALLVVLAWLWFTPAVGFAQRGAANEAPRAEMRIDGTPHAGVPFGLVLEVAGLDESPAPIATTLTIAGARVTPGEVRPNVSRSISIINGQREDRTVVVWLMSWQVVADKAGPLTIPPVTASQGSKKATAKGGTVTVQTVPTTDDMKLELVLPQRPVWVGETLEGEVVWLVRRDVQDQTFSIPLFEMPDDFVVTAPAVDRANQRALPFTIGKNQVPLGYQQDEVQVGGSKYARLRFPFLLAPRRAGKLVVPPSAVSAQIAYGRPNIFGEAPSRLFRVADSGRTLEVKELPLTNRPAAFAGAVGESFALAVTASRSVVAQGEPLELTLTVKSDQRLDALGLAPLGGPGALPASAFACPREPPAGELAADGKSKVFKVQVQVVGPTTELPAIELAYFNPKTGQYQSVKSEPIALSVKGGAVVSANDVIAATPRGPANGGAGAAAPGSNGKPNAAAMSLVGADLTMSTAARFAKGVPTSLLYVVIALCHLLPVGLLVWRTRQAATAQARAGVSAAKAQRKALAELLSAAKTRPARDVAGELTKQLMAYARVCQQSAAIGDVVTAIENHAYAPDAASKPLPAPLIEDAQSRAMAWKPVVSQPAASASTTIASLLVTAVALGVPASAHADAQAQALTDGRAAYQAAMAQSDASARQAAFARAAGQLRVAAEGADNADVLADWGNAALASGDTAQATLAYRRALRLDPDHHRATQNLSWLRSKLPTSARHPTTSAAQTFLFFHQWPTLRKLVVASLCFAIGILFLVPWGPNRRRLPLLASGPLVVWAALVVSALLAPTVADDAVVMDGVVLRASDNAGAPAASGEALPVGLEVVLVEQRRDWVRVRTPAGMVGWLPSGAIARVAPAK